MRSTFWSTDSNHLYCSLDVVKSSLKMYDDSVTIVATLLTSRTDQALRVAPAGSEATIGDRDSGVGPDASCCGELGVGNRALYAFCRDVNDHGHAKLLHGAAAFCA